MSAILKPEIAEWHAKRAKNVGASEVAALFGLSPYMSKWTLWQIKAGRLADPTLDSDRIKWGNRLEAAIAQGIAEDEGWKVRKVHRYINHPSIHGMGASLDYEIVDHPDGPGALEIKNVDGYIFRQKWQEVDEAVDAPLHIELQLQHQLSVSARQWGAIGALVGGNESKTIQRKRHEATIQKIERGVDEFWWSIDKGKEPPLTDSADLGLVASLFNGANVVEVDSLDFEHLCQELNARKEASKAADNAVDESKLKVINLLMEKDAEIIIGRGHKVTYKEQTRKEHSVKASTFRVLRVGEIKGA